MGEQEAKVRFSETGSEQVVSGFKNVGTAAGGATTNIGQAGNAIKDVGSGMKSAVSGIAQTATAFATLALSVVSTWRSYRDLGDAQLAVDRANFKVQKSTQAVTAAQALVNKIKASSGKTDLKAIAATSALISREDQLKKKIHDGSITRKQAKAEQDAINLARSNVGTDKAALLAKAEQDLKNKQEQLGLVTESAAQKQKHFNDSQQDFYLSIVPTAISVIATAVSGFESMKNMVGAGSTGLVGGIGGLGIVLGVASVALLAYQNNWLGFRDIVGGAIDWVKERLGVWKDTLTNIFNLIKSGNWAGAFDLIKQAAIKFWSDLKASVPLFGFIDGVIANIRNGEWGKAFDMIKQAATKFWEDMKTAIPFLADVEKFITDISQAKWGDVFNAIASAATTVFNETFGKGIAFFLGDNWKLGLDAWLALQEAEAKAQNRPLILQYAIAINATITSLTGIDVLKWFKDHPLTTAIPFFGGITMMVDDPKFRGSVAAGSMLIITKLGEALTRATQVLDPYIAGLIKPENWINAIKSTGESIKSVGKAIWDWIFLGIKDGVSLQDWTKLLPDILGGIEKWMKGNAPETTAQLEKNAAGGPLAAARKMNIELNPLIPDNAWTRVAHDLQVKVGAINPSLEPKLVLNPAEGAKLANAIKWIKPVPVPFTADNTKMKATLTSDLSKVMRGHYPIPIDANMEKAYAKWNEFSKKVTMTTLQVKIAGTAVNIRKGSQAGAYGGPRIAQGGMHENLSRDTIIIAHKNERVDIDKPSKMTTNLGIGRGVNVKVYIGNEEFKGYIHTTVNEDQGNTK